MSNQVLEYKGKEEADEAKTRTINNIEGIFTRNNSRHYSLSFKPSTSLFQMSESYHLFCEKLVNLLGIGKHGLSAHAFRMTKPHDHIHAFFYSVKSRRTGRSVANMPAQYVDELKTYWHELTGGSLEITPGFSPMGWIDYIFGPDNIRSPGQKWEELEPINEQLLKKKQLQKNRRIATA